MKKDKNVKRAEAIETAFYAIERTFQADRLFGSIGHSYQRYDELGALVRAMKERTADLVLDAFDGHLNGEKFWPRKKRHGKSRKDVHQVPRT